MTAVATTSFYLVFKRCIGILLISFGLLTAPAWAQETSAPFDPGLYVQTAANKAVVLLSIDWSRRWNCGQYENAQLQFLAFDRSGVQKTAPDGQWDLMVKDESILPSRKSFGNYAYIIEPGEYLLTGFRIKLGKSMSNVGNFFGDRKNMLENGKSKGGSFTVAAGEIIYIGHFSLDCAKAPMPWRFYLENREEFDKYLDTIQNEFPGIPKQRVQFRLFETTIMGYPFSLP